MFRNLRLVESAALNEYMSNNELWLKLGNERFAAAIESGAARADQNRFQQPWLVYHAWRNGALPLDSESADAIRHLMQGKERLPQYEPLIRKLEELGWCDDTVVELDQLVSMSQNVFIAIQNPYELREFLERVRDLSPKVVVEIGSARGGMLYCFSQLADPAATLVSIDLPGAPNCGGQTDTERTVFASFGPLTQSFHFIPENSQLDSTRDKLADILGDRRIDLLFIDGDHSYAGCMSDFEMYKGFVDPGGLIVFHDTRLFPERMGPDCGVGVVWNELNERFGGEEIVDPNGVPPDVQPKEGERWHWGIGILEASKVLAADGADK